MRLFVTGGAGFIGSNYVRHVLASTDDDVTVFDALTYAGKRENLGDVEGDARFTFVEGDICDREAVGCGHGGPRRGRPLRGREPRRPLDRRPRRVREDQLRRDQRGVRRGPARRRRALPPHLDRRGLRLDRRGQLHRGLAAVAPVALLGEQGRQRPHRPLVPHDLRPARRGDAVVEQLRTVPVPREGHPAVRHEPDRRRRRCRSTATAATSATGASWRTTAPRSMLVLRHGAVGEIYNIGGGNEITNRELTAQAAVADRVGTSRTSSRSPIVPATTGGTRSRRARSRRSAGARPAGSTRRSKPRSRGTATTAGGGSP